MIAALRLPVKLALLGLVPLSAVAGMSTWRVFDNFEDARASETQADEVQRIDLLRAIVDEIEQEVAALNALGSTEDTVLDHRASVDRAIADFLATPYNADPDTLAEVTDFQRRVPELREVIPSVPSLYRVSGAAADRYVFDHGDGASEPTTEQAAEIAAAVREMEEFADLMTTRSAFNTDLFIGGEIARDAITLQLFDELATRQHGEGEIYVELAGVTAGVRTDAVLELGRSAGAQVDLWHETIDQLGSSDMVASFASVESSAAAEQVREVRSLIADLTPGRPMAISAADIQDAFASHEDEIDAFRSELSNQTVTDVEAIRWNAERAAYITMAAAALFVGVVGLLILFLYHSIRRPLRKMTERSLRVATKELPDAVATMRSSVDAELPQIEAIEIASNDEIGQLVGAFNQMSATALELAGEQAQSRRSVGDMFMNLGRRNQKLLSRMLRNLDELERNEEDAEVLQALYDIDHLATRMRRNAESLLILAGAEQSRRFGHPVAAGDVIRSALAEVENYDRVEIVGECTQLIAGEYIADLAHLIAELVENALAFSAPETTVHVSARMTQGGLVFAVSDDGIGMSAAKLEEANSRIVSAQGHEETPSMFLGLFVVGRLAARRDIEVKLFESPTNGVVARIALPEAALAVESAVGEAADAPIDVGSDITPDLAWSVAQLEPSPAPVDTPVNAPVDTPVDALVDPNQPLTAPTGAAFPSPDPTPPPAPTPTQAPAPAATQAPAAAFGSVARRPGATLVQTLASEPPEVVASGDPADRSPARLRQSLSGFQSGTGRADSEGETS